MYVQPIGIPPASRSCRRLTTLRLFLVSEPQFRLPTKCKLRHNVLHRAGFSILNAFQSPWGPLAQSPALLFSKGKIGSGGRKTAADNLGVMVRIPREQPNAASVQPRSGGKQASQ